MCWKRKISGSQIRQTQTGMMPRIDLTLPFQDYYVSVAVLQCLVEPGKFGYVISCVTSDLVLLYNVNKSLNQILHCSLWVRERKIPELRRLSHLPWSIVFTQHSYYLYMKQPWEQALRSSCELLSRKIQIQQDSYNLNFQLVQDTQTDIH